VPFIFINTALFCIRPEALAACPSPSWTEGVTLFPPVELDIEPLIYYGIPPATGPFSQKVDTVVSARLEG
jgi:hypothetical protein